MLRVGCRYSAVSPIYMSNDRLEPFNCHNIAFKRCADVVSLERLDRLWFFRHHWFVKIGWFGKCWTDLLAFWGVWNRSRILNFGPDRLFFRFSRALHVMYFTVCIWSDRPEQTVQTQMSRRICGVSSGSTLFATHPAILDTTVGSKLYLFKF